MHQTLRIPEILLNIFGHCTPPLRFVQHPHGADLAVLARTCRTFKEPALDVLWEELYDLSPLARCLPEACRLTGPMETPLRYFWWNCTPCYLFSRPLKEVEWETLRAYARRVRFIHGHFEYLREDTIREIFSLAPFDDPLFPRLRSLHWDCAAKFAPLHVAVQSLTKLRFNPQYMPHVFVKEFFEAFGDRCPRIENLVVDIDSPELDSIISCVLCCWPNLQEVVCPNIALSMDAILYLSSVSNLRRLEFTTGVGSIQDISRLSPKLVFSNLTDLDIRSRPIDFIVSLLRSIRLPVIETVYLNTSGYISRRTIQAYWAAVQEACPHNVLTCFQLYGSIEREEGPLDEELLPCITLEDLRPCTAFTELRELYVDFDCPVNLTDADLLELVSPQMESFLINYERGWGTGVDGGGITLGGLVQLLRQRPSLEHLCLAIDTRTFTAIPDGLDMSFPPRARLKINLLDSYILSEFIELGLVSVFTALGQDPSMLIVWEMGQWTPTGGEHRAMWDYVLGEIGSAS